jgi:hypothetical protein
MKHKLHAKPQWVNGIYHASQKQLRYEKELELLVKSGEVLFFIPQVPFRLPGGVKFVLDYLVFWANGEASFIEVKGFKTPLYIAKKKMVEALYPIEIIEV